MTDDNPWTRGCDDCALDADRGRLEPYCNHTSIGKPQKPEEPREEGRK